MLRFFVEAVPDCQCGAPRLDAADNEKLDISMTMPLFECRAAFLNIMVAVANVGTLSRPACDDIPMSFLIRVNTAPCAARLSGAIAAGLFGRIARITGSCKAGIPAQEFRLMRLCVAAGAAAYTIHSGQCTHLELDNSNRLNMSLHSWGRIAGIVATMVATGRIGTFIMVTRGMRSISNVSAFSV